MLFLYKSYFNCSKSFKSNIVFLPGLAVPMSSGIFLIEENLQTEKKINCLKSRLVCHCHDKRCRLKLCDCVNAKKKIKQKEFFKKNVCYSSYLVFSGNNLQVRVGESWASFSFCERAGRWGLWVWIGGTSPLLCESAGESRELNVLNSELAHVTYLSATPLHALTQWHTFRTPEGAELNVTEEW